ncbi:MAG: DUF3261 domain-containing protein [Parvibaculum sp.]|nr:DUF3261 domain-containing protein [Parvibaculum sp.]
MIVGGCVSRINGTTDLQPLAPDVTLALPDAPVFGSGVEAVQLVQARYQGHQQMFQSVIRSRDNFFTVLMTVPSGPRIMRIDWTPVSISSKKEAIAPTGLSPERMLADLMLVYAPKDMLRKAIGGAVVVEDKPTERKVMKDGRVLVLVTRPDGDVWNGRATLTNYAFDYELKIQSQRVTDE